MNHSVGIVVTVVVSTNVVISVLQGRELLLEALVAWRRSLNQEKFLDQFYAQELFEIMWRTSRAVS